MKKTTMVLILLNIQELFASTFLAVIPIFRSDVNDTVEQEIPVD